LFQKIQLKIFCEVCLNILKGNIPISNKEKDQLKRYENLIRYLSKRQGHRNREKICQKRKLLIQKGAGLLRFIIPPLLSIVGDLVFESIMNNTRKNEVRQQNGVNA